MPPKLLLVAFSKMELSLLFSVSPLLEKVARGSGVSFPEKTEKERFTLDLAVRLDLSPQLCTVLGSW